MVCIQTRRRPEQTVDSVLVDENWMVSDGVLSIGSFEESESAVEHADKIGSISITS